MITRRADRSPGTAGCPSGGSRGLSLPPGCGDLKTRIAPNAQLQEYGAYSECLTGLENKVIDALTTDDSILAGTPRSPSSRASSLIGLGSRSWQGDCLIVLGLLTDAPGVEQQTSSFNAVIRDREATRRDAGQHFRYVEPPHLDAADLPDQLHPNDNGYAKTVP